MADAVFPFPGGKSRFASWILDLVPDHECFVEVFGGAAGVLVNKDPETSRVEVYNDKDGDLVQFFEVLRERPDELREWLELVPFSRRVYELWAERYYQGYRPADPIARAGQFFFLRYTQWGGIYDHKNGFATAKTQSKAAAFSNKIERLGRFARRFADVVIEQLDWRECIEKYDGEETIFYLDPPYVGQEDYYPEDDGDHEALVDRLGDVVGRWLLSYEELPAGLEKYHVVERGTSRMVNSGQRGHGKDATERLVLNFDPEEAVGA